MAIAPVLPWRKASGELLRQRIQWPLTVAVATVVLCVAFGVRGLNPLLVFGLGAFAAGSAGRQLVLATRRQGLRGLLGRANGGMIVHIGVVVIAVAFAGSKSFGHQTHQSVSPGQTIAFAGPQGDVPGHRAGASRQSPVARGEHPHRRQQGVPPRHQPVHRGRGGGGRPPQCAADRSTTCMSCWTRPRPRRGGRRRSVSSSQPLIMWLWLGGGIIALGTAPGRLAGPAASPHRGGVGPGA